MSITNYTELQAAIASWAKRSDLTAVIPDFIALAEVRIARALQARPTEYETELTMTVGSRYVALPTGFDYPLGLWIKSSLPREPLPQRLPENLSGENTSGVPEAWAIDGENIAFDRPASETWAFDFRYAKPFALSVASPTNYILTNHPDVYLFGAMVEVSTYTADMAGAATWETRFARALEDAANEEHKNRAGATLATDLPATMDGGRFDIERGY